MFTLTAVKNTSLGNDLLFFFFFLTCHSVDPLTHALCFKISVSVPQEKPLLTTPAIQSTALRVLLTISTADRAQKDSVIKAVAQFNHYSAVTLICHTQKKLTLASCI